MSSPGRAPGSISCERAVTPAVSFNLDVMKKGIFLCGGVDTVCDLLTAYQQKIGFGHLICLLQFGTLPADLTRRNLEVFARKVIPRVRHLGEHAPARAAE